MAFTDIPHIRKPQEYLDSAFLRARKGKKDEKIKNVKEYLLTSFNNIQVKFPDFFQLPPFYKDLAYAQLDVDMVRKALAHLQSTRGKISRAARMEEKAFHGRIGSLLKKLKPTLNILKDARKTLCAFPILKTDLPTVVLVGFPNVGKTSLLEELTGSKGNIQPYAFTTVTMNLSYLEGVQLIDTPGMLGREKKNAIEMISWLAVEHLADALIYVFDPSEASAPLPEQEALYELMIQTKKPVWVYKSKKGTLSHTTYSVKDLKEKIQALS